MQGKLFMRICHLKIFSYACLFLKLTCVVCVLNYRHLPRATNSCDSHQEHTSMSSRKGWSKPANIYTCINIAHQNFGRLNILKSTSWRRNAQDEVKSLYVLLNFRQLAGDNFSFLAHLAQSARVSYWGCPLSGVRRRACVRASVRACVRRQQFLQTTSSLKLLVGK